MLHARAGGGDPGLQLLHGDARARAGGQGRVRGPGRGLLPAPRLQGGGSHLLQHHHLLLHGRTVGSSSYYHHPITNLFPSICAGADLGILPLVPLILLPPPVPRSRDGSEQEPPATWSPYNPCPGTGLRRWVGNITLLCCKKAMFCLCPQFCWSRRGHLAEIKSEDEEETLDQYLVHGILYWIGLSDLAVEGRM